MDNYNIHITNNGDTWDTIAEKVYGDCGKMGFLQSANQELSALFIFPANVYVRCPVIKQEREVILPPWAK